MYGGIPYVTSSGSLITMYSNTYNHLINDKKQITRQAAFISHKTSDTATRRSARGNYYFTPHCWISDQVKHQDKLAIEQPLLSQIH